MNVGLVFSVSGSIHLSSSPFPTLFALFFSLCLRYSLVWFYVCLPVVLPGQCLQDTNQYVLSELQALETEQKHIDSRAAIVEKRLRKLMETGKKNTHIERK